MAKKAAAKKTTKKRKSSKKRESKQRVETRRFLWIFLGCLVITFASYILFCILTMPDIEKAIVQTRQPTTTIIAGNGNEINTYGNIYRDVVMLYDVKPYVVDAILSTEDRRFYSHFGFDLIAFGRAMTVNVMSRRYAQGGSTITQQVAKNLFLTKNKTIRRKVQELLLSFWLEYKLSKDQILTLYINRVYLGSGTYGIQAASQKYFQKPASDLNMKEAAIIAGMLKAPSRYNPINNRKLAIERSNTVLQNMVNNQVIDKDQMEMAMKMPVGNPSNQKVDAKHFADWVYSDVNILLGERDNDIIVYTTLNQELQENVQRILDSVVSKNKDKNVNQGAIVVLDRDGAVLAMAGGTNYNSSQFNRAVQALRQPGSAFKTFVYLSALQEGIKPSDTIEDIPVIIGKWSPENITGKYYGKVTLTEAFVRSLNLATVNLSQKFSYDKVIKVAKDLGISTDIKKTPAMVLGSFEVKVLDMAGAYATIANEGHLVKPYAIREAYNKEGYQIYQRNTDPVKKVVKRKAVKEITKMMEKVISKGTGTKAQTNRFAAGKTGTSQKHRDAWFVGFTEKHTIAVWFGNDDNSPMKGVSGGNLPAETWKKVVQSIEK